MPKKKTHDGLVIHRNMTHISEAEALIHLALREHLIGNCATTSNFHALGIDSEDEDMPQWVELSLASSADKVYRIVAVVIDRCENDVAPARRHAKPSRPNGTGLCACRPDTICARRAGTARGTPG